MNLLTTNRFDDKHWREERAVFSIFGTSKSSISSARRLHALQHRGLEATGIISFDGKEFHAHRRIGRVGENFGADHWHFSKLTGYILL